MSTFVYVLARDVAEMFNPNDPARHNTYYSPPPSLITKPGELDTALYVVQRGTTIETVVEEIARMAGRDGMNILRICGHGAPGTLKLGPHEILFEGTVHKFKPLNGRFVPNGRIELHSCRVAGGDSLSGETAGWFEKLATFTGVRVLAGSITQQADRNWKWEGPVHTFYPLGGNNQQDGPSEYDRSTREQRQSR